MPTSPCRHNFGAAQIVHVDCADSWNLCCASCAHRARTVSTKVYFPFTCNFFAAWSLTQDGNTIKNILKDKITNEKWRFSPKIYLSGYRWGKNCMSWIHLKNCWGMLLIFHFEIKPAFAELKCFHVQQFYLHTHFTAPRLTDIICVYNSWPLAQVGNLVCSTISVSHIT